MTRKRDRSRTESKGWLSTFWAHSQTSWQAADTTSSSAFCRCPQGSAPSSCTKAKGKKETLSSSSSKPSQAPPPAGTSGRTPTHPPPCLSQPRSVRLLFSYGQETQRPYENTDSVNEANLRCYDCHKKEE